MTRDPDQGISKDGMGQEQPVDKKRAQTVNRSQPDDNASSHEATRDPKLTDAEKTPGSGMAADDDEAEAPSG